MDEVVRRSSVHNDRASLKPHIDLLPPCLNRCFNSRLLRREGIGQVELRFGHARRIMLLDGELCRESPFP
jgi:hypothetical protein